MVQAFLPIGPLSVTFDTQSNHVIDRFYGWREVIHKRGEAEVPTTAFLDPAYASISAAIHSSVDAANFQRRLGGDFYVLHNPNARNPLPLDTFTQWRSTSSPMTG